MDLISRQGHSFQMLLKCRIHYMLKFVSVSVCSLISDDKHGSDTNTCFSSKLEYSSVVATHMEMSNKVQDHVDCDRHILEKIDKRAKMALYHSPDYQTSLSTGLSFQEKKMNDFIYF